MPSKKKAEEEAAGVVSDFVAPEDEVSSNAEADQLAADKGFVFDLQLNYFEQRTESDLLFEGFTDKDVARVGRVLKKANKTFASKNFHPQEERRAAKEAAKESQG